MTKTELFLKKSPLYPALVLENYFSNKKRRLLIRVTKYLIYSIPIIIILTVFFGNINLTSPNNIFDLIIEKLIGIVMVCLGGYILMQMFEAYFGSIYYLEYVAKNKYNSKDLYTFSAGRILIRVDRDNLLTGLLKSQSIGRRIIDRLGISEEEANNLLLKQSEIKNPPLFDTENIPLVKVMDIVNFIYDNHNDFRATIALHGLGKKDLQATVKWIIYDIEAKEYERQWWTKDKLAKAPGVASDWSFGRTYLLNKYSKNLLLDKEVNSEAITFSGRERELNQIQTILARSKGANIILVGLPGQEKMEVIWNLCKKIRNKKINLELTRKKPVLFLTSIFTGAVENADDFTNKLIVIFTEVLRAGNIILVIDNLPRLILQAKQFDLNLNEILAPYLISNEGQIIALSDTNYFHTLIESDVAMMSRFETVMVKPLLLDEIIEIISREALNAEKVYEVFYTYPAILEIAKSAENYFPDGVSSDKAEDLLSELSPWATENNIQIINRDDVLKYVSEKTNIPIASITPDEKEKLLNLENLLMKRVIAQKEAIFAISGAIRRSRAGIRNEKRPLGSFLFFGPTGVGKTETAKALADVFFGDEKLLMRLDR